MPRAYTRDEILDAFRQAVRDRSPALMLTEFTWLTGISLTPVRRHFGSWSGLRAAAGLAPGPGLRAAGGMQDRHDFLLAEARRLAGIHGERLTLPQFCREANVAPMSVRKHCESWQSLRTAAGLTTPRAPLARRWTEQAVLEEYERVTRKLCWCPSLAEFGRHSRCSASSAIHRFGGIRRLQAAYRAWLQHRASLPGPDARLARHLLDWCVDLSSPR